MIEDAITFAAQAHLGKANLDGEPYIFHPLRVMLDVQANGGSEAEIAAAVLHDTVEDTDTTLEELAELFSPEVAALVDHVSRRDGEDYLDYVRRAVAGGPGALRIKQADLRDNSDPRRLARVPEPKRSELQAKYQGALDVIERALTSREAGR
jgi:(p)ppGpp synthase/HD superfamily hydrolase